MRSFYLPFGLTVGGMLFYHLAQKSIPREMNPFFAVVVAYAAGIVVCIAFAFTYSQDRSMLSAVKQANWAVLLVGIAAASIEVGFMLAYRSGWRISVAAVATNVAATAMLVPVGLLLFKEQLSTRNIIGLLFCILGLVLVIRD